MGQQQLMLLVLSALIVGAAVVVGINMFTENAAQANMDAVQQDCMTIATRAMAYWRRPVAMGGGGRSYNGVTLGVLNFPDTTANGIYSISGDATRLTITGNGFEDAGGAPGNLRVEIRLNQNNLDTTIVTP